MLTTGQSVSTHSEDKWSNLHRLMSPSLCLMGAPTIDVVWVLLFWPFEKKTNALDIHDCPALYECFLMRHFLTRKTFWRVGWKVHKFIQKLFN